MASALKHIDWNEIQRAAEHDMDDDEIHRRFKVSHEAIRQRRLRAKRAGKPWMTTKEKKEQAMILAAQEQVKKKLRGSSSSLRHNQTSEMALEQGKEEGIEIQTAEVPLVERLLRGGEKGSDMAQKVALKLLEAAKPEEIRKLMTVQDLATALGVVRKAAGMDKPQIGIALAFNPGRGWSRPDDSFGEAIEG